MVIKLKGLNLDGFPLSALAAYGLTRLLNKMGYQAELGFINAATRPYARLGLLKGDNNNIKDIESLSENLVRYIESANFEELGLHKGLEKLKDINKSNASGNIDREFYLAYIKKEPNTKKGITRTPFDTTKGNQKFLNILRKVINSLRADQERAKAAFIEALSETVLLIPNTTLSNKFKDTDKGKKLSRIGWHPSQFRRTADQARIANEESKKDWETIRLNPAAVFLAWEAIPLYPFVPGAEVPLGFAKENSTLWLFLPTPARCVNLTFLKTLVALAPSLKDRAPDLPIWRSRHVGSLARGDDYPCFLEAHPARSTT